MQCLLPLATAEGHCPWIRIAPFRPSMGSAILGSAIAAGGSPDFLTGPNESPLSPRAPPEAAQAFRKQAAPRKR
jgi:hypothetical protein